MLVWGCVAHLVVMLADAVPRWTPLWAVRILALETALCFPLTFRVSAPAPALCRVFLVTRPSASMSWTTAALCASATWVGTLVSMTEDLMCGVCHNFPWYLQVRFVHALPVTALKCFTSLTIVPQVT